MVPTSAIFCFECSDLHSLFWIPVHFHFVSHCTGILTFVQHWTEDGQVIIDSSAVPSAAAELVLALLDADFHPLRHTGHYFHVVATEAELFGDQARDGAAEDGLGTQWGVLVAHR